MSSKPSDLQLIGARCGREFARSILGAAAARRRLSQLKESRAVITSEDDAGLRNVATTRGREAQFNGYASALARKPATLEDEHADRRSFVGAWRRVALGAIPAAVFMHLVSPLLPTGNGPFPTVARVARLWFETASTGLAIGASTAVVVAVASHTAYMKLKYGRSERRAQQQRSALVRELDDGLERERQQAMTIVSRSNTQVSTEVEAKFPELDENERGAMIARAHGDARRAVDAAGSTLPETLDFLARKIVPPTQVDESRRPDPGADRDQGTDRDSGWEQ